MRPAARMRSLVAAGLVAAVAGCGDTGGKGPGLGPFFGVNAASIFQFLPPAELEKQVAAIERSGIEVVRVTADWEAAEKVAPVRGRHTFDWTEADRIATQLARHHLQWLPVLAYTVTWARTDPAVRYSAPRDPRDFAGYVAAFTRRYGAGGEFWATHSQLPELPVGTYEIWNEPDLAHYWRPAPQPGAYARLYVLARRAIHARDADAVVIVGGLQGNGAAFLRGMFAAVPGLAGQVDGVGLHPYARGPAQVVDDVVTARRTLRAFGAGQSALFVTEVGWPTSGSYPIRLGEAQRATALATTADRLARSNCGVEAMYAFDWATYGVHADNSEEWFGLFSWRKPGQATASGAAYVSAARRLVSRLVRRDLPLDRAC